MPDGQLPSLPENAPMWVAVVAFFVGPFAERIVRMVMGAKAGATDAINAERAYLDEKRREIVEDLSARIEKLETENHTLLDRVARLEAVCIAANIEVPK